MGFLDQLQTNDLRKKNSGMSSHISQWKAFYGKPDIDRKLNFMLDTIQDIVGEGNMNQVFIHDKDCPSCKTSFPKFTMLKKALSKRLKNYSGIEIELDEKIILEGKSTEATGRGIYEIFKVDTKGVPFVLQDASVNEDGTFTLDKWHVIYIGKLDPFRFLASAFNIENERMST